MSVLDLICSNGFITVNRAIASIVGLEAAAVLGEIATEYSYWQEHDPDFDGEFYSTIENLENRTFLNAYSQRLALSKLQEHGWITVKKKGMPARRFIRVHEDKISEVVNDKSLKILTTGDKKNERQVVKNFNGKNNIVNNNIKEEINNKSINGCSKLTESADKPFTENPLSDNPNQLNTKEIENIYSGDFFKSLPDEPVAEVVDKKEKIELLFADFWKVYPKKANKKDAFKAFKSIKNIEQLLPDILADVEMKKNTNDWQKENGRFIPYPGSYLRGERWNDVNEIANLQAYQNELVLQDIQNFNLWRNEDDAQ